MYNLRVVTLRDFNLKTVKLHQTDQIKNFQIIVFKQASILF